MGYCVDHYNLHELKAAVEGACFERWNHTSALLCLLYNANRGKNTAPKGIDNFHPLLKKYRTENKKDHTNPSAFKLLEFLSSVGGGKVYYDDDGQCYYLDDQEQLIRFERLEE